LMQHFRGINNFALSSYIGQKQMQSQSRDPKTFARTQGFLPDDAPENCKAVFIDHIVIPGDGDGDHAYAATDLPQAGDFVFGMYESEPRRFVVAGFVAYPTDIEITGSKAVGAILLQPV
jgi:hypothetical protein